MPVFCHRSVVAAPVSAVFQWHERPDAIEQLLPARLVRIVHRSGGIRDGGRVVLALGAGPVRVRWEARHFGYMRDRQFGDEQVRGPFLIWRHTHGFRALGRSQTLYEDRVEYALRGGRVVNWIAGFALRPLLRLSFARRHAVVRAAVEREQGNASRARIRAPLDLSVDAVVERNGGQASVFRPF